MPYTRRRGGFGRSQPPGINEFVTEPGDPDFAEGGYDSQAQFPAAAAQKRLMQNQSDAYKKSLLLQELGIPVPEEFGQIQQTGFEPREPGGFEKFLSNVLLRPGNMIKLGLQDLFTGDQGANEITFSDIWRESGKVETPENIARQRAAYGFSTSGSDILSLMGIDEAESGFGKFARGVAHFAVDVLTDPFTYTPLGAAGVGSKVLGKVGVQAVNRGIKEAGLKAGGKLAGKELSALGQMAVKYFDEALEVAVKAGKEFETDGAKILYGLNAAEKRMADQIVSPLIAKDFAALPEEILSDLPAFARGGIRIGVPFGMRALSKGVQIPGTRGLGRSIRKATVGRLTDAAKKSPHTANAVHVLSKIDDATDVNKHLLKAVKKGDLSGWQYMRLTSAWERANTEHQLGQVFANLNKIQSDFQKFVSDSGIDLAEANKALTRDFTHNQGVDIDALFAGRPGGVEAARQAHAFRAQFRAAMDKLFEQYKQLDPNFELDTSMYMPLVFNGDVRELLTALVREGVISPKAPGSQYAKTILGQILNELGAGGRQEAALGFSRHASKRRLGMSPIAMFTDNSLTYGIWQGVDLANIDEVGPLADEVIFKAGFMQTGVFLDNVYLNDLLEPLVKEMAERAVAEGKTLPHALKDFRVFQEDPFAAVADFMKDMSTAIAWRNMIDDLDTLGLAIDRSKIHDPQAFINQLSEYLKDPEVLPAVQKAREAMRATMLPKKHARTISSLGHKAKERAQGPQLRFWRNIEKNKEALLAGEGSQGYRAVPATLGVPRYSPAHNAQLGPGFALYDNPPRGFVLEVDEAGGFVSSKAIFTDAEEVQALQLRGILPEGGDQILHQGGDRPGQVLSDYLLDNVPAQGRRYVIAVNDIGDPVSSDYHLLFSLDPAYNNFDAAELTDQDTLFSFMGEMNEMYRRTADDTIEYSDPVTRFVDPIRHLPLPGFSKSIAGDAAQQLPIRSGLEIHSIYDLYDQRVLEAMSWEQLQQFGKLVSDMIQNEEIVVSQGTRDLFSQIFMTTPFREATLEDTFLMGRQVLDLLRTSVSEIINPNILDSAAASRGVSRADIIDSMVSTINAYDATKSPLRYSMAVDDVIGPVPIRAGDRILQSARFGFFDRPPDQLVFLDGKVVPVYYNAAALRQTIGQTDREVMSYMPLELIGGARDEDQALRYMGIGHDITNEENLDLLIGGRSATLQIDQGLIGPNGSATAQIAPLAAPQGEVDDTVLQMVEAFRFYETEMVEFDDALFRTMDATGRQVDTAQEVLDRLNREAGAEVFTLETIGPASSPLNTSGIGVRVRINLEELPFTRLYSSTAEARPMVSNFNEKVMAGGAFATGGDIKGLRAVDVGGKFVSRTRQLRHGRAIKTSLYDDAADDTFVRAGLDHGQSLNSLHPDLDVLEQREKITQVLFDLDADGRKVAFVRLAADATDAEWEKAVNYAAAHGMERVVKIGAIPGEQWTKRSREAAMAAADNLRVVPSRVLEEINITEAGTALADQIAHAIALLPKATQAEARAELIKQLSQEYGASNVAYLMKTSVPEIEASLAIAELHKIIGYFTTHPGLRSFMPGTRPGMRVGDIFTPNELAADLTSLEHEMIDTARSLARMVGLDPKKFDVRASARAVVFDDNFVNPSLFGLGGSAMRDILIQKDVGQWFEQLVRHSMTIYTPEGTAALRTVTDNVLTWWKGMATVTRPTFHIRNLIGGVWNNQIVGVGTKDYLLVRNGAMKLRAAMSSGKTFDESLELIADPKARRVFRHAFESGVMDLSFSRTEYRGVTQGQRRGMGKILSMFNPFDSEEFGLVKGGAFMMESIEDFLRVSAFAAWLDTTSDEAARLTSAVAKEMTLAVHFDYRNLTEWETAIKRFIPFFVWSRRNIPLQLQVMMERPGLMTRYAHLMAAVDQTGDDFIDQDNYPGSDYWSAYAAGTDIVMNRDTPYWARLFFDPDLPVKDILEIPFGASEVPAAVDHFAGLLGPHLTLPFELSQQADYGDVNAPAPMNVVMRQLAAIGLFDEDRATQSGDYRIPYWMRTVYNTTFPWAKDIVDPVVGPTDPQQAARLGDTPDEENMFRRLGLSLGRGVGLQVQTPGHSRGKAYEADQTMSDIMSRLQLSGQIDPMVKEDFNRRYRGFQSNRR